jgi:hypothetical protein
MMDLTDMTSFTWATVKTVGPLSIQLDGDSAPLALIPETLIDPLELLVGSRVRVELSLRKVVIHGVASGSRPQFSQNIDGQNLNNLITPGLYDGSNMTNTPDGTTEWFYVRVQRHSNRAIATYATQEVWKLTATNAEMMWRRVLMNGTWYPWVSYPGQTSGPGALTAGWNGNGVYWAKQGRMINVIISVGRTGGTFTQNAWTGFVLATGLPPAAWGHSMDSPRTNQYEYAGAFYASVDGAGQLNFGARWTTRTFNNGGWIEAAFSYIY